MIFASFHLDLLLNWHAFCCRASDATEPSKLVEQKTSSSSALPSVVVDSSDPSPSVTTIQRGAGLVSYDFSNAKASAHWVLQYLGSLKNTMDDWEGNGSYSFNSLNCLHFCWLILHTFV
jgi:hypothetical protein